MRLSNHEEFKKNGTYLSISAISNGGATQSRTGLNGFATYMRLDLSI
jgi:hypothetical protein